MLLLHAPPAVCGARTCSNRHGRTSRRVLCHSASSASSTSGSSSAAAAAQAAPAAPPAAPPVTEEERFHAAYAKAMTMSQLYVQDRPEAVPLTEWDARRKKRDMDDIAAAAKRRGKDPATVRANLEQLEALLPDLINLHKMSPKDWVALAEDVGAAANKLIALKTCYETADVFAIVASRPKMLLQSEQAIVANAQQVRSLLSAAEDVDAIIQAVPELSDPSALSRSLAYLASAFPGQDAVALLQQNPRVLLNLGESDVADSAEYGEMTTKD